MIYERAISETIQNHLCKIIYFHGLTPVNIDKSVMPENKACYEHVLETKSPINAIESLKLNLSTQLKVGDNIELGSLIYYYGFKCEVINKMNTNNELEEWGIRVKFYCSLPKE